MNVEWADLTPDLLEKILLHLPCQKKRIRPTAMCSGWLRARGSYGGSALCPIRGPLWRRLVCIQVRAGMYIDCIEFEYSDGSSHAWGNPTSRHGKQRAAFELVLPSPTSAPPGAAAALVPAVAMTEDLVAIEGTDGDALDSVTFITRSGRRSETYGNVDGGREFQWSPFKNRPTEAILGFRTNPPGYGPYPTIYNNTVIGCTGKPLYPGSLEYSEVDWKWLGSLHRYF